MVHNAAGNIIATLGSGLLSWKLSNVVRMASVVCLVLFVLGRVTGGSFGECVKVSLISNETNERGK